MTTGERIKERRVELGMTQLELAKKLGYKSKSTINKIELGVQNLKQSKIKAIADALLTTPNYIVGWADADGNPIDVPEKNMNEHDRMTAYAESLLHRLDDSDLKNITRTMEGWLKDDKYKKGVKKEIS